LPVRADASGGGRPPLNNPGVRLPPRPAVRGALVTPCGLRTVRTRPPWRDLSFRRRPVGSSWPPVVPRRCGCLWYTVACTFFCLLQCSVVCWTGSQSQSRKAKAIKNSTQKDEITAGREAVRAAERMRDFRTSDRDVAKRRARARDGASRRAVRNPEEAKGPRSGGDAGRSPGSRGRGDWRPLVGRLQKQA